MIVFIIYTIFVFQASSMSLQAPPAPPEPEIPEPDLPPGQPNQPQPGTQPDDSADPNTQLNGRLSTKAGTPRDVQDRRVDVGKQNITLGCMDMDWLHGVGGGPMHDNARLCSVAKRIPAEELSDFLYKLAD